MKSEFNYDRLISFCTTGLTDNEVNARKQEGLINKFDSNITKTTGEIIRSNLFTWFNLFHFAIGVALLFVGAYKNMLYLIVVSINIIIGIMQELHAKKLVEDLSLLSDKNATVIRNSILLDIPIEEIVLGDLITLAAGKQICTDSVVTEGEIEVNESLLTGEADPIIKHPGDILFSGSFVVSGKCHAQVNHVGKENFAASLSLEAKKSKHHTSKLMDSMQRITKLTSCFAIPIGIILFVQAFMIRNQPADQSVIITATALLGMLPKGMELLIGVSLISGIIRISQKKVLVQDLYCLENLAQTDTLCLDKTGTITEGRISVCGLYEIDASVITFSVETAIRSFIGASDDNNATFKALQDYFGSESNLSVITKTPFSSERKWSAVTFENVGTLILGAPEQFTEHNLSRLPSDIIKAQRQGKRIICLGYSGQQVQNGKIPPGRVIAAIALKDGIRENVRETLNYFTREGVEIKIISGDSPVTVSQIAKQAGIERYDSYVDMSDIYSDEALYRAAADYCIFGRVTPNQKCQLVKALKKQGHTVAMVGDGVNDVLALKEADCSIAMNSGSTAAKQVAQLVLLDSDFSVLPDIVMEGRRVVNNITRVGGIFLVKTAYSVLLSILCILANVPFPFSPIQITLIDLIIEAYPSFFMQFEPDYQRIRNHSLTSSIQQSLPFASAITVGIGVVYLLSWVFTVPMHESLTVMFYLTGGITILAVFKACRPLNNFRIFLLISTTIAFMTGAYLFQNILGISLPSGLSYFIFLFFMLGGSLILSAIMHMIEKGYGICSKQLNNLT